MYYGIFVVICLIDRIAKIYIFKNYINYIRSIFFYDRFDVDFEFILFGVLGENNKRYSEIIIFGKVK